VLNRVWDTPSNGYAEKFKHTVEPVLTLSRTTAIDDFDRVVSGVDNTIVGGTTGLTYGINNRLYAKRRLGATSQSQEIARVSLTQSYYTDRRAAQADPNYQTSNTGAQPSNFTPLRADLTISPTTAFNSTLTAEIDPKHRELRSLSAGAGHNWANGSTTVSWTQRFFIENLIGFNDPNSVSRTLTLRTTAHTPDFRYGGTYSFTLDAFRSNIVQQTAQAYYNAQCCGFSVQYMRSNTSLLSNNDLFLFSFTLAGLGSFSPFNTGSNGFR
jgi:LPS-assembly protein